MKELQDILRREGGYVDHPADRGGATNFGITAATLGDWRGLGRPATPEEVRDLTQREALAILKARYLTGPGFDRIRHRGLRALLVDCAVHHGPARAARWLQEACGVAADGVVGPKTLAAANAARQGDRIRKAVLGMRLRFIGELISRDPSQAVFARGWLARVGEFL